MSNNELLKWTGPEGLPDFSKIEVDHFIPAIKEHLSYFKEIQTKFSNHPDDPTFENTFVDLEIAKLGQENPAAVFYQLAGNHTNPELQAIEAEVGGLYQDFYAWLLADRAWFKRIDSLYQNRETLGLKADELRLLEKSWNNLMRNGANLNDAEQAKLADINKRLNDLFTKFGQNVLSSEQDYNLILEDKSDLAGLPDGLISAMAAAATERGHEGKHALTLSRSIIDPFLTFSERRDLREVGFKAWAARGEGNAAGEKDNRPLIKEIVQLRAQKAELLGYKTFADFKLDKVTMAKTPDAVNNLLSPVWEKAKAKALAEKTEIEEFVAATGTNHTVEPWDWRFYQERVRAERYAFNEAETKPYLQLERMIEAAFDTATRLFNVQFKRIEDAEIYHPDVRLYEALNADGKRIALFTGDYFARSSKRSGAWMSAYQGQHKTSDGDIAFITNTMNFAKPPAGEAALLSFDDARTLFHEFGHALHGMMSDVTFPQQSGTSVSRDFVELPSQLFEHWLSEPEVLQKYATHVETGEPMPRALLDKMLAASRFDAGFATVEFTSSALVDMAFHNLSVEQTQNLNPMEFQEQVLAQIGMPREIIMRHASPHFLHVFSGDGYSAGYYSYMWSEVLDADAFQAFKDKNDAFDPETAQRLLKNIYSSGGSVDPEEAYIAFRGKLPTPDAMIAKKGLV